MNSRARVFTREQERRDKLFRFMRKWGGVAFGVSAIAMYTDNTEHDARELLETGVALGCIEKVPDTKYYAGSKDPGQWKGKFFEEVDPDMWLPCETCKGFHSANMGCAKLQAKEAV